MSDSTSAVNVSTDTLTYSAYIVDTGASIAFNGSGKPSYYLTIVAYYKDGTSATVVNSEETATYTVTGNEDLLLCNVVSG